MPDVPKAKLWPMPTHALPELQRDFWHALADDPGHSSATESLLAVLEPSATMDAGSRLQIYVDAYFARIQQVLRESFPRLASRLGDDEFRELVNAYLRAHPSQHPSIGYIGVHLAAFLRTATQHPAYLADLAALEWTHSVVFESENAVALSASVLHEVAAEDWPTLRFRPISGMQVLTVDYPVHLLWRDETATIDRKRPTRLRVWRTAELTVMHSVVDEREAAALQSLLDGADFATICEAFADLAAEQAAEESIALLLRWLEDGILAASVP